MQTTHASDRIDLDSIKLEGVLLVSFELGLAKWTLTFGTVNRRRYLRRDVPARCIGSLVQAMARAKKHFRLPSDAPVVSCYEAGRDGHWLDRCLAGLDVRNVELDSASIERSRRRRQAKTDRLDGKKLLELLMRLARGESACSVVNVPKPEDEDGRQLHRELQTLKKEHNQHASRMQSLLATMGLAVATKDLDGRILELRLWDGSQLGSMMKDRLRRELARLAMVKEQIAEIERERSRLIRTGTSRQIEQVRKLMTLRAIGENSSWLYVMELFGWREIRNRRQLAGLAGLAPTPFNSGGSEREQGISKAGNKRIRSMAVEIAWLWRRYQPDSQLTRWFEQRFGGGGKRMRRIGIVAMARKLLVELWKFLETGVVPEGAKLKANLKLEAV